MRRSDRKSHFLSSIGEDATKQCNTDKIELSSTGKLDGSAFEVDLCAEFETVLTSPSRLSQRRLGDF